jgi:hypothetical protein
VDFVDSGPALSRINIFVMDRDVTATGHDSDDTSKGNVREIASFRVSREGGVEGFSPKV